MLITFLAFATLTVVILLVALFVLYPVKLIFSFQMAILHEWSLSIDISKLCPDGLYTDILTWHWHIVASMKIGKLSFFHCLRVNEQDAKAFTLKYICPQSVLDICKHLFRRRYRKIVSKGKKFNTTWKPKHPKECNVKMEVVTSTNYHRNA